MGTIVIELMINLMEYWILLLTMQHVCGAHIRLSRRAALLSSLISLTATALALLPGSGSALLLSMPCAITAAVLLFSRKKPSDLLRFFPALGIYFALSAAPELLLDELAPASHIEITFFGYTTTLISLSTDLLLLSLLLILRYLLNKHGVILLFRTREILGGTMLLFFAFITAGMIMWLNRSHFSTAKYLLFTALFLISFVFIVGYFFYNLYESHIRISRQMLADNELSYLRLQLEALQDTKENEEEARKLRHDLASHLAVMKSLCEEGEYDKVRDYAEQLSGSTSFSGRDMCTGNQIADLIVSSKMKAAAEQGTAFTFEGSLERLTHMTAPDLCGLLCNAYDNALEACRLQKESYISTKASTTRHYTVIRIANPVEKKAPVHGNRIATTKPDPKAHGCGVEIMKQIVAKYHGSCTIKCSNTVFEVTIVLPV